MNDSERHSIVAVCDSLRTYFRLRSLALLERNIFQFYNLTTLNPMSQAASDPKVVGSIVFSQYELDL